MKMAIQSRAGRVHFLAGLLFMVAAFAQNTAPTAAVLVNEKMPLRRAAELLQLRYGVPISYEDGPYEFGGEIDHPFPNATAPKAGTLNVDLSPPLTNPEPLTVERQLQGLMEQHARNGNPGQFKVIETAAGLAIVAAAVRERSGILVPYQSPLDARITFPEMERDARDAIAVFLKATEAASGKKLALGGDGVLKWRAVRIGANNEVARDVLAKLLATVHPQGRPDADPSLMENQDYKASWIVTMTLPAPGYDGWLYLTQVATERPGPNGTIIRTPVPR
jgi:hypothetical protein